MMCPSPRHVVSAAHLNLISGGVHERESCLGWSGACGPYAAADTTVASVTRLVRRQSTSMIIGLLPLPIGCMSLNAYLRVCLARRGRFSFHGEERERPTERRSDHMACILEVGHGMESRSSVASSISCNSFMHVNCEMSVYALVPGGSGRLGLWCAGRSSAPRPGT